MCECVSVVLVGVCDVCACACVMCGGVWYEYMCM